MLRSESDRLTLRAGSDAVRLGAILHRFGLLLPKTQLSYGVAVYYARQCVTRSAHGTDATKRNSNVFTNGTSAGGAGALSAFTCPVLNPGGRDNACVRDWPAKPAAAESLNP